MTTRRLVGTMALCWLLAGALAAQTTQATNGSAHRGGAVPVAGTIAAKACPPQPIDINALIHDLDLQADEVVDRAWRCTDQSGEHLVTVSRVRSPGQRGTQVLFTQRSLQGKSWKKDWQARDFFIGSKDRTADTRNRVMLHDADRDGHLEAYIGYVLPGPSQSVDEGKLLVFSHGRKYAIRGAIPRSADDFGSRQIGPAFYELPNTVQAQALILWDQLSKPSAVAPLQTVRSPRP